MTQSCKRPIETQNDEKYHTKIIRSQDETNKSSKELKNITQVAFIFVNSRSARTLVKKGSESHLR